MFARSTWDMFSTLPKAACVDKLEEKVYLWRVFSQFHLHSFQADLFGPWRGGWVRLQPSHPPCLRACTLFNFLSNVFRNAPQNEKQEVCACALVKTSVTLRDKLLEG